MKKLFTVVALAASVISAPAFAKTSMQNGAAYQQYTQQSQESGIPWVDDQAKGSL
jgi:hypothetical protein